MEAEGVIRRSNNDYVVEVPWQDHYLGIPGVERVENGYFARKVFRKKRIYLPTEYDRAVSEWLAGDNTVVFSMNGYTTLNEDRMARWMLKPGQYESGAARALHDTVKDVLQACPGLRPRFIHGAIRKGIDAATIEVATQMNCPHLGFNCPLFMLYVQDDPDPVYVAEAKGKYVDAYTRTLDILIGMNGGKHSFDQDIKAAIDYKKRVILVNLIEALTLQKTSPFGPDGEIEDAVVAFMELVSLIGRSDETLGEDRYDGIISRMTKITRQFCRNHISPKIGYGLPETRRSTL